jgi:septal ring factor EnvC (AmiA/AmiB activator)
VSGADTQRVLLQGRAALDEVAVGERIIARPFGMTRLIAFSRARWITSLVLLLVLGFGFITPPVFSQPASEVEKELAAQRKELDAVRARLQREQRELAALKNRRSATQGELNKLQNNIAETNRYLKRLEETERKLDASVRSTRGDLVAIEGRLKSRSAVLAKRARLLYMGGRPEDLLFLPAAGESDFLARAYMTRRLLEYDRRLIGENRLDMSRKQDGLKKLLVQSAELDEFQKRKTREMASFTSARNDQEKTLKTLQRDEANKARTLKQLEENAKKLDAIIRALEKRRRDAIASGRKGRELETGTKYCAPVQGKVVSRYGLQNHATLGTSTRNLGIEIEGSAGTGVRAAVSGEVAMVTAIPGYGPGIILDNGSGYFTIYANLAGIKVGVGDVVKTCQEMATLAAQPGTLYFEVRRGTKTQDPEAWLRSGR